MAVPHMIGRPGASVLYSGSAEAFHQYKPLLDLWGAGTYHGDDAGLAPLYDLALLAGMYVMFAGFVHGAVQRLIQRQIDAGHGTEGFARIFESIRHPA